jgi:hypothetical protein
MAGSYPFGVNEFKHVTDVICSIPASGAGERMAAYGNNYGRGTARVFSGGLVGKTLLITDTTATNVAQKEIKFTAANFNRVNEPTLAEIVAAINAVLSADAAPTAASAGPQGELVITGAAAGLTAGLTIGAGTANVLLGFPKSGVFFAAVNGTGVSITFPAGMQREYLYSHAPFVDVMAYTPATGVRAVDRLFTATWTPSSRVLLVANAAGAARVGHIRVAL